MRLSIAFFALLLMAACGEPQKSTPAPPEPDLQSLYPQLQTGDIVLRNGKDELSRLFRNLNATDRSFSHCGILLAMPEGPKVVHIIESGSDTVTDLQIEDFSKFVSPKKNESFLVIRYAIHPGRLERLPFMLDSLRKVPVHFDIRFNLSSDTELYCTEMVYKVLRGLAVPDSFFLISESRNGRRFIGVDGLYLKNQHKTICGITYK